jgi:ubiquinone/menaquinone biosynthesis C-methylase UbiE
MDAALVATAEAYPKVRYAAASALDLPFPSEQFNTALLAWSL